MEIGPADRRDAPEVRVAFVIADLVGFTALTEAVRLKNIARPVHVLEIAPKPAVADHAVDPVCRMRIDVRSPGVSLVHRGVVRHFCSPDCAQLFLERTVVAPDAAAQ